MRFTSVEFVELGVVVDKGDEVRIEFIFRGGCHRFAFL